MPCSGAHWRTCSSDGNAPGTRAAGAGARIESEAYLPRASGRIRLSIEEVAERRFDPCTRMEIDGGVGPEEKRILAPKAPCQLRTRASKGTVTALPHRMLQ